MADDWDLYAVVRGCTAHSTAASTAGAGEIFSNSDSGGQLSSTFRRDFNLPTAYNYNVFEPNRESFISEELQDLYKPFFPKLEKEILTIPPQSNLPISPLSVLGGIQDLWYEQHEEKKITRQIPQQITQIQQNKQFFVANFTKNSASHSPSPRSKRRKINLKKVCHVAAENLSSDMWSWRKYGQKPIKGSPYPRGYYKCSTLKGCLARKQVERNRSDPGMFIVTYTAEHNHPMPTHRNSLAGSTRLNKPSCSPASSPAPSLSPAPEKDLAEIDDDLSLSNMELDDDFFAGLENFAGECMSDNLPANLPFPWLAAGSS